jgi:hypothetical protein
MPEPHRVTAELLQDWQVPAVSDYRGTHAMRLGPST